MCLGMARPAMASAVSSAIPNDFRRLVEGESVLRSRVAIPILDRVMQQHGRDSRPGSRGGRFRSSRGRVAMSWVPLLFVLVATAYDLKTREVPDAIPLSLLGWAVVATAFRLHDVGWASMLGGLAIGLVLSAIFFALGGLGGGDVK